jgi:flavodoxin
VIQTLQQTGNTASAAERLAGILNGLGVKTTLASGSSTNLEGVHVYIGKKAI